MAEALITGNERQALRLLLCRSEVTQGEVAERMGVSRELLNGRLNRRRVAPVGFGEQVRAAVAALVEQREAQG